MTDKHIEQCKAEEVTSELFDIAYSDRAGDLVTSSISKAYAEASDTEEVKGDFTSNIAEIPATLKLFVKRLFSAPAKVFGGKSMSQMFGGVKEAYDWLKERVKGSDGIPKKELPAVEDAAHLAENLRVLDSRKVDVGELDCQDGVDLIQLFGTKGFADSIEHVVVGREGAVYERNLTSLMSYFSGAKSITLKGHATMSCAGWALPSSVEEFTYEGEYIYDDNMTGSYPVFADAKNCKQFNFPNLRVISRKGSTGGNSEALIGSSVPWSISLPKLESVRYLSGMTAGAYEVATVSNPILELPSLKEIHNSGDFPLTRRYGYCGFTQLICPNLETVLDSNLAIGYDGNPLELYYAPKLKNIASGSMPFPTHSYSTYNTTLYPNLIDAWVGEINVSMNLQHWGCANIINDEEKTATLNKNIREHMAARIADRTGKTALTVTFLDLVYAKLEPETIAAFTQKNWTVASKSA